MSAMKQVIINADDFGLTSGVNQSILTCHKAGSVTSATLMVNMPAALEAAEIVKAHPELGVGLHFTLTLGQPIRSHDEVPGLVDNQGLFHLRSACEKRLFLGRIKAHEVQRELLAQFDRFLSFGLMPTHLDSHQHIHLFPVVFDVIAEFCVNKGLPLRIPWVSENVGTLPLKKRMRRQILKRMLQRNWRRWGNELKANRGFISIFDFGKDPGEVTPDDYLHFLSAAGDGPIELMVHPAHVDAELEKHVIIKEVNQAEQKILSDPSFPIILEESGYSLVTYASI